MVWSIGVVRRVPRSCTTCANRYSSRHLLLSPALHVFDVRLVHPPPPQPAPTQVANDDLCVNLQAAYDLSPEEYDEVMYHILARQNVMHEERASYS